MPVYPFQAVDGEVMEEFFSMAEVPSIGTAIERDGKTFVRRASSSRMSGTETERTFPKYPYLSHSLPIWTKPIGMKMEFDRIGRPVIRSPRHEANVAAAYDLVKL